MKQSWEALFKKVLTKKEFPLLPRSFDIVGDILIFSEFPEELKKKEKMIGTKLIKQLKNIAVVLKKTRKYGGTYRLPRYKIIAGERRKKTIHKESNARFTLHLEKVYFSSRLSTERLRIADQIKKGETVLVMFSGIGVYPIVISKNSNAKEIVGIEINPDAHAYGLENVELNKVRNVTLVQGDVWKVAPKRKQKFDCIVMPLPKTGEEFLPLALTKIKKGGIIHYYCFAQKEEFDEIKERIRTICNHSKKKCNVLKITKCGQMSPGVYRACFDIRIK